MSPAGLMTAILGASLGIQSGLAHPLCRRVELGGQTGRACPSMYCLMMDRGAPPQETAK